MLLVGLTGGIGSGKSTVAAMLAERGAVVIDADELARRAIDPGTPGFDRVVEAFGPDVLTPGGEIDRAELAARVFSDEEARRTLESIVHPEIFKLLLQRVEELRDTSSVVVFDAPLIVETGFHEACDVLVVVTASVETQIERLVASRGMTDGAARDRIAAQAPMEEKVRVADVVIVNDGNFGELREQVDRLWPELAGRAEP